MNLNDDKFCDWEDVDQASAEEMEDADAGQDGRERTIKLTK